MITKINCGHIVMNLVIYKFRFNKEIRSSRILDRNGLEIIKANYWENKSLSITK